MNIFSRDDICHSSRSSLSLISSSFFRRSTVLSAECFSMELTPINEGLSSTITQVFGETEYSQSVSAYNASIVLSGDTPGTKCRRRVAAPAIGLDRRRHLPSQRTAVRAQSATLGFAAGLRFRASQRSFPLAPRTPHVEARRL